MAQGATIPLDKREEFRAHYLVSGNASDAARKVGLNERTGRDIAAELVKDPEFSEARRVLRAQYLDELVAMRMDIARTARDKAKAAEADIYPHEAGLTVIDKRKEWADVVLNAEKNAHALAKIEKENDGSGPVNTEVHIHLAKDDGEPSQEA